MTSLYHVGDTRAVLRTLPAGSVDLIVSSPPFLALRSYLPADHPDKPYEIGSESTPGEFLDVLLDVVEECARVLAPHGSLCFELGDTYAGSGGAGGDYGSGGLRAGQNVFEGSGPRGRLSDYSDGRGNPDGMRDTTFSGGNTRTGSGPGWPLAKSLCLIPQSFAFALSYGRNPHTGRQTDPWRVRNVVRWWRPNPPVGALGDKWRPATSEITVACKSARRYWDDIATRDGNYEPRSSIGKVDSRDTARAEVGLSSGQPGKDNNPAGAPLQDTWRIPTAPYKGSHYACVDDQTEALTPTGWKRHHELRDGDLIATVDESGESWRFEPATFHRYQFDGDLVAIDKRVTNQRLTPNHRVMVRTRKQWKSRVLRADELSRACFLPVAAEMEPGGVGPGEKAAALAGWFCAEGGMKDNWPVIHQSQSANPHHCDTIRSLLDAAGCDYMEKSRSGDRHNEKMWIVKGPFAEWLRQFHKNIPWSTVWGWSESDLRAMFGALIDGDGHRRADGRMQFIQKSRTTAERVQLMALRLGYRTTISNRRTGGYSVFISPGRWVDLRAGVNGNDSALGAERYVGTVWCPSVPTGFWFARRGGQPFITGNTYPPALVEPLVKAMAPPRVCRVCGEPSRRILQTEYEPVSGPNSDRNRLGHIGVNPSGAGFAHHEAKRKDTTVGWTDCGHDDWRRAVICDPFAGTGTTLMVANGHGHDAIGIDLDARNADLARERLGMFLEVVA